MEITLKIIDRPLLIESNRREEPLMVYCGELKEWNFDQKTNRFTIIGLFKTFSFIFIKNKENSLKKLKAYLNGELQNRTYFTLYQTYVKSDMEFRYDRHQLIAILKAL